MTKAKVLLFALTALFGFGGLASAQSTAVEYHHAGWNYYFVTSFPAEIASLDGGAFGGVWRRTGQTFPVWPSQDAGTSPVCRFFSTSFSPRSSHFYTPFPSECSDVRNNQDWQYEAVAFYLKTPDLNGNCPASSSPLYRFYNDGMGGAPNHRYTTSTSIAAQMRSAGWVPEGFGVAGVLACVPGAPTAIATAEGMWTGTTSANQAFTGVILNDGTFYILYSPPNNLDYIAGVIQGSGFSSGGQFTSSNVRDFNIVGLGVTNAAVAGTYVPRSSLSGILTAAYGTRNFSATYQSVYEQPASLAAAAGTYSGQVASSAGIQNAVVTINSAGQLTGSVPGGCSFTGTAAPRGNVNIFNLTVRFLGGTCIFGTSTLNGIAYYSAEERAVYGAAPNASRSDGFLFVGVK